MPRGRRWVTQLSLHACAGKLPSVVMQKVLSQLLQYFGLLWVIFRIESERYWPLCYHLKGHVGKKRKSTPSFCKMKGAAEFCRGKEITTLKAYVFFLGVEVHVLVTNFVTQNSLHMSKVRQ